MKKYYLVDTGRNEEMVINRIDSQRDFFSAGPGDGEILVWHMPEEELRQILAEREVAFASRASTKPGKELVRSEKPFSRQHGASGRFSPTRRRGQSWGSGEVIFR